MTIGDLKEKTTVYARVLQFKEAMTHKVQFQP